MIDISSVQLVHHNLAYFNIPRFCTMVTQLLFTTISQLCLYLPNGTILK